MLRRFRHWLAVGLLAFALPLSAQDIPPLQSKVFGSMPAAEIDAIRESRRKARDELFKNRSRYDSPEIAIALEYPNFLIAVAKVTAVEQQDKSVSPYLKVDLEIQQFWRGYSEKTSIYAESRWSPPTPERRHFSLGGPRSTALDNTEPKPGNVYLIGYTLHIYGDSGSKAYIPGAIDFSVPGQGQTFAEIQHYLTIDASAGDANFAPFVAALDDPVPWIRDLALHRLASSDACRAAPVCGDSVISRVRELLQSKEPWERWEAVEWLHRLMSGLSNDPKQSAVSEENLRALLNSAISDPNPFIGDQAFSFLAQGDFSLKPSFGQCLEIIPELRKSAMWDYAEVKDRTVTSPLGSMMSCNSPSPSAAQ